MNFFHYSCKINLTTISINENLHPYCTTYIRFIKIHITSQNFFRMEYCVMKSMSNIYKETFWNRGYKKGFFFLKFHLVFKIFFQNSSLGIINAHQSLAKRLWGRERGLGESSKFSHPLGRELDGDWWGWWQLLMRKISKFLTHFIAQISWFTLENLVILNKRSKFWIFFSKN